MTTYTLHVTAAQAQTISRACEVLARLGIGQVIEGLRELPQAEGIDWTDFHDDCQAVSTLMSKYMPHRINGYSSNLGIYNADKDARLAWDLHQVLRHRLAWDRAKTEGWTDGTTRNWNEMMGVHYDEPLKVCEEPLAKMEINDAR